MLVARNVVKLVEEKIGKSIPLGTLDIGLYRDDLSKRLFYPEVRRTDIPFSVEGKRVVLVDDVLNTGRSVRAAIEHIVDSKAPGGSTSWSSSTGAAGSSPSRPISWASMRRCSRRPRRKGRDHQKRDPERGEEMNWAPP